jgi:flavin reductase (DIM6/NTAB) family NADH-FMN oxidoreductase RutF
MKKSIKASTFTPVLHPYNTALITTKGLDSKPNIIAIAWIIPVSVNPPALTFAIRKERYSYKLLLENGEFVVNIPELKYAKEAFMCGTYSGRNTDKFSLTKFTPVKSEFVSVPSIEECVANIECRVLQIVQVDGLDHVLVVGEVLNVLVEEELFDKHWDTTKVSLLLHLGGDLVTTTEKETKRVKI